MIDLKPHIDALDERIATAVRLIDETHPTASAGAPTVAGPISREARGLAIVLLFAAYENLLTSLTRTLLERATRLGVSNKRLQPGFKIFALRDSARSARELSERKMYSHALPRLIEISDQGGRVTTIATDAFPADGSFMKRSQIQLWCEIFGIANPGSILFRCWTAVDSIVTERNGIAHGRLTPDEVGRNYSETEIRQLISDWHQDWSDFLSVVGSRASSRDFFRVP